VSPRDPGAIAQALESLLRRFHGGIVSNVQPIDIEQFDRRYQAGQFAAVFRSAMRTVRPAPADVIPIS
jgi:hypothetical protein